MIDIGQFPVLDTYYWRQEVTSLMTSLPSNKTMCQLRCSRDGYAAASRHQTSSVQRRDRRTARISIWSTAKFVEFCRELVKSMTSITRRSDWLQAWRRFDQDVTDKAAGSSSSSSSSDRVDSRGPLRQPRVATTTSLGSCWIDCVNVFRPWGAFWTSYWNARTLSIDVIGIVNTKAYVFGRTYRSDFYQTLRFCLK